MKPLNNTLRSSRVNKTDSHQLELEYLNQKIFERYRPLMVIDDDENQTLNRLVNNVDIDLSYKILKLCVEDGVLVNKSSPSVVAEQRKFQSIKRFIEQLPEDPLIEQSKTIHQLIDKTNEVLEKYCNEINLSNPITSNDLLQYSLITKKYQKVLN
ncbi:hypothetical protein EDI_076250 [Entamoeba dispar SAW760]|uniref:Uncharacterized protein n=1 Tax=Entamoeba dispar (strain ATCC PRA-260 / SAW760) TaxID=370354 RepID=B0EGZ4_ENTDS|nr:uncharacterized protein EDI_076250 [Entamoeba dispar SAW760]EDR26209.1 hypothetical protein EDI_076250 [Entamoeba dispar SAW760]|eukprot:EDR26209.1 hypothetical protein EDI_076250 [Entamoeba dispar SAW760]